MVVAAITTVVCQWLRQPVVMGYIVAGIILGPHVPLPLVADRHLVETLSELGVILLMFSLGLEFTFRRLRDLGPQVGLVGTFQVSVMIWLGFAAGRGLGLRWAESLFVGAILAISSTTIIAKAFEEQKVDRKLKDLVYGVLIVEDLLAVLLLTLLPPMVKGTGIEPDVLVETSGRLFGFLLATIAVGMLVVPRLMRQVVGLRRTETTVVASVGICFLMAELAHACGYSVALGAFVGGVLVAESGHGSHVEGLIHPVKDLFAAIFFVSVGMLIDPRLAWAHSGKILVLTLVTVAGKIVAVGLGAFLTGSGVRDSIRAGMSLAQIGEFSFILATLGVKMRAARGFLYPLAVGVSILTTILTPWLIRWADPFARWVDARLPRPVQAFATTYTAWVERRRAGSGDRESRSRVVALATWMALDALVLGVVVAGAGLGCDAMAAGLAARLGIGAGAARAGVILGAGLLVLPFGVAILRLSRALGTELAGGGRGEPGPPPPRALVASLQLACLAAASGPILALTQPLVDSPLGHAVVGLFLAAAGLLFWGRAGELEAEVKAGAERVFEVLSRQSYADRSGEAGAGEGGPGPALLGAPRATVLGPDSPCVGRSLAQIGLRGRTGAMVVAIRRADATLVVPTGGEVLRAGDELAMVGTREALEAAELLLRGGPGSGREG